MNNNEQRIISDIKDSLIDCDRMLTRKELSDKAVETLASQLNQCNNWAQQLHALRNLTK